MPTLTITTLIKKYGFVSNPDLSPKHRLHNALLSFPLRLILCQPRNKQYHNLCINTQPPDEIEDLLGLGVKFCPQPRVSIKENALNANISRFRRNFHCKVYFGGSDDDYDPNQLRHSSGWEPKAKDIPIEIRARTAHFGRTIRERFTPRVGPTNLTPLQKYQLKTLRENQRLLGAPADKNLGFVMIERTTYTEKMFSDHLSDQATYQQLSENHANELITKVKSTIIDFSDYWYHAKCLSDEDKKYLKESVHLDYLKDPFSYLYGTIKVHKDPWMTRPVVSTCGSATYGLGKWCDQQLQPVVKKLQYVIHSTTDFMGKLRAFTKANQNLPWRDIKLWTADAKSMYTFIDTSHALEVIGEFLHTDPICDSIQAEPILEALSILMKSNVFCFDDTFWLQLTGTVMGTSPACAYANIYQGTHENTLIPEY